MDQSIIIDIDLFPKCECCKDNMPGLLFCVSEKCSENKKYYCLVCMDKDTHDHKSKKTQLVIDEVVRDYREKWDELRANVQKLVIAAKERFAPHEYLIRHLEGINEKQEERKDAEP